jgi:hypothetical protein
LSGHVTAPESSPNLSASRPGFPAGRLNDKSAVSAYSTIIPLKNGLRRLGRTAPLVEWTPNVPLQPMT